MNEPQTMTNIWMYADAQPSLEMAATTAIELAAKQGAALNIIGVLETEDEPLLETPAGRDLVRILRQDKQDRLNTVHAQASRELGTARVTSRLVEGEVAWHTLARQAVEEMPDLIVVPADDGATAGRFGTLSQHLFRKCPSPVWSVLPSAGHLPKRTLVAVDPGVQGSDERLLSLEVLRVVSRVLAKTETELHLAHAWSLHHENLIASRLGPTGTQQYLDIQLQYSKDHVEQLLAEAGGNDMFHAIHHPKGEPGKVIPALAEEIGADLVVVGSAARRGLQGFFIGSVAETILSQLRRSALVLKRPGFVSPVRGRK